MEEISAIQGNIHSIETFGALEGPGIRYVAFLQGCPLHCLYCHNPDTWAAAGGRFVTAGELFQDILQYRNFIARGGVTLSGGEPLLQAEFCHAVLQLCKQEKIHTAIDTSGCIPLSRSSYVISTTPKSERHGYQTQSINFITGFHAAGLEITMPFTIATII